MEKSTRSKLWSTGILILALGGLLAIPAGAAGPAQLAAVNVSSVGIEWQPAIAYEKLVLTVSGPDGLVLRREVASGIAPSFGAFGDDGKPLSDGAYNYELVASPVLDPATRQAMARARRTGDDSILAKLQADGKLPRTPLKQSGTFTLKDGTFVSPDQREDSRAPRVSKAGSALPGKDVVTADDAIIQGSLCVGLDCVNNESFGFDTIRLKENNTRIKFDDTSSSAGFPNHDWQLTANDSASGGANKFSIEDITAATVPFTVTGSAPTNAVFVDGTGRLGLRTATPVLDIHIATGNTPAMRLEQNSSGGFTAQTWDIAGNEANFFVRDVTGGSRLPFRIRPGAPTSSVDISATGNVGVGTASPSAKLHVTGSDGTTMALVSETSGTAAARTLLQLANNGDVKLNFSNTNAGANWELISGTTFIVNRGGSGVNEMIVNSGGNVTIAGTLTQNSDRTTKTDINLVDPQRVLAKVVELPISTWRKIGDSSTHLGPMSQDFAAAFGLGEDDRHIAPIDLAGVSLAAIKALQGEIAAKDTEIAELKQRLESLEAAVAAMVHK